MIDRRAFLGAGVSSVLSLPFLGSAALLAAPVEPIIIHDIFRRPTVAGHWLSFGEWQSYEQPYSRRKITERTNIGFIDRQFAGYFTMKDYRFMVDEPLWGKMLLRERWMEKFVCKDDRCMCHDYERHRYYNYDCHIIEKTPETRLAPKIGWERFSKEGYDNIWPITHVRCACGKVAGVFTHIDEKAKMGFKCHRYYGVKNPCHPDL